jgi:hypothetical protein
MVFSDGLGIKAAVLQLAVNFNLWLSIYGTCFKISLSPNCMIDVLLKHPLQYIKKYGASYQLLLNYLINSGVNVTIHICLTII